MSDVDVHLNIALTPRLVRGALFLFFLSALPGELASEAVTLNSYYPAPSGIYTQMITTGNTFLARDGGYVGFSVAATIGGVGTMPVPTVTPGVNPTKLIVLGGNVGIGTPDPGSTLVPLLASGVSLDIQDARNAPVGVAVNGQILTGDGTNNGGVWLNGAYGTNALGPTVPYVGTSAVVGPNRVVLTNGSNASAIYVDNIGNVSIGINPPLMHLDVNGIIVGRSTDLVFSLP
ncbi:MAG: hypothetical protein ACHQ51_07470 [Elusimicrobiota bacterium]